MMTQCLLEYYLTMLHSEVSPICQPEDPGEYSDDFDESDDEDYSDEFEDDSELNGNSLKKPLSATKLTESGGDKETENEYPDDFEDDSEEEEVCCNQNTIEKRREH